MCQVLAINYKLNLFWLILIILISKKWNVSGGSSAFGCLYFEEQYKYSCPGTAWIKLNLKNMSIEKRQTVEILEIYNIHTTKLNLSKINERFPNLVNVTIWKANITTLIGRFSPYNKIEILRFTNTSIRKLPHHFFTNLKHLKVLNLTKNLMKAIDERTVSALNNVDSVYLAGNPWNCSLDLQWILDINDTLVKDMNEVKCYESPYRGKALLPIAQFIENVKTNCPSMCECWMFDVVVDPSNFELEPIIEVNCTDRNLIELPSILPAKTKILMLAKNGISNLDQLITNPIYSGIHDLYLDNNLISSIRELEGAFWFSHFRVLSLKNNLLKQLPTYALDNALQQNPNMPVAVRLFLGNNPWKCDCSFTPGFQEILRKYQPQIKDPEDIQCAYSKGEQNSMAIILDLSRSSVCSLPSEYSIRPLDLVNGILASLIVLILGKLAYDYYYFKKTGRLPWIVTKMP